ncbi:TPA: phage portal protein [Vibrio parahaemolyticus]|uniref:portal protein n=1 Tax=Vibrio parahaemolyticus TaxID=670 RepID=UPI00111EABAC|nr:portal protein [Vibrio parahaemolyticus]MBE3718153.1 phage portal protein [Vibrio parahaemolyticus]MBE3923494.1 phage portal protein [Vibrio parahaemolyticus]MBE4151249.1 phage portal protein [Vibrio parahaemolyticus]MBE4182374.1 phage portal protein [Vibrio parahaemolyticus]TOI25028.1 phage portal protein [Vibrio parahaemolyticus]
MSQNKASIGLAAALKQAFPFFNENDDKESGISFESGAGYTGSPFHDRDNQLDESNGALTNDGRKSSDRFFLHKLPKDRFMLYPILKEMAEDSTIDAALNLHLGHALSVSNDHGMAVYLHPTDEKYAEYVGRLNRELLAPINDNLMNWTYSTLVYGVNYVRPYTKEGVGITHFEANYYTLPNQIREYERSGELAGFTAEYLQTRANGEQVRLAEPWALIPLKMPIWRPDMDMPPVNYTGQRYSLYDDAYSRMPIETQNYGTSILLTCFEAWSMLRQSIAALGASRVNASLIDRMVAVNTDGLDAAGAAEYINMVADQMKQDRQEVVDRSRKLGFIPTVINTLLPFMGGAKGGLQIDTFTTDPNISHIEDIMFHLKRLAGTLGVDPSMLGFGDLLSGGLGEGGFFRASIQSALRANQIRAAVAKFVKRAIDIHTIYRDGKVWSDNDMPFEIRFNSLNTAIEQEKADAMESQANYATMLATVLDLIEQSPIGKSEKLKNHLYTSVIGLDSELAKEVISELAAQASKNDKMMESIGMTDQSEAERFVRDVVLDLLTEIQSH